MAEKFFGVEDIKVIGLTSTKDLIVSGISTLGVTTLTNVTAQQLNVSGITTLGVTTLTHVTAQQLNVSGVSTLGVTTLTNVTAQQLNVSGVSTLGVTTLTNVTSQQLIVSGISTIGNIFIEPVGTGASVGEKNPGVSGVVTFYGDGSGLRNVVAIGTGIDIQNSGTEVGSASTINFNNNLTGSLSNGVYTINGNDQYWIQNSTGIHTLSNVGIGTTNASVKFRVATNLFVDDGVQKFIIPSGYSRQLSPQVGTALTNAVLTSDSTRRTDAEFYDYCWDNYDIFDLDGDGIVSPMDAYMFLYWLLYGNPLYNLSSSTLSDEATRRDQASIEEFASKYNKFSDSSVSYTNGGTTLSGVTTIGTGYGNYWFRMSVGIAVTGTDIPSNATVTAIGTNSVTISQAVTSTATNATVYYGDNQYDIDGDGNVSSNQEGLIPTRVFGGTGSEFGGNTGLSWEETNSGRDNSVFLNPNDGGPAEFTTGKHVGIGANYSLSGYGLEVSGTAKIRSIDSGITGLSVGILTDLTVSGSMSVSGSVNSGSLTKIITSKFSTVDVNEVIEIFPRYEWYLPSGYSRQVPAPTGIGITANALPSDAIRTTDAEIYDYCWDNYDVFDVDGDGIVSPLDGIMCVRYGLGSSFAGANLYEANNNGVTIPWNATRDNHVDMRKHLFKHNKTRDSGVSYTSGGTTLSGVTTESSAKGNMTVGIAVTGTDIPSNATVTAIGTNSVTISQVVTSTATNATVYFGDGKLIASGSADFTYDDSPFRGLGDGLMIVGIFGSISGTTSSSLSATLIDYESLTTSSDGGPAQFRRSEIQCIGIGTTAVSKIDTFILDVHGKVSIADTTSNAGGARYISTEAPTAGVGKEGDIWYDVSATGDSTGTNGNIPIGGIIMWYGSVANIPISWRLCDGQSHSTAIGTIQTPDLRGQFVVGAADDSVEGTFSNNVGVGSTGGDKDAVLIAHKHTVTRSTLISGTGQVLLYSEDTGQTPTNYDTSTVGQDENQSSSTTETGVNKNLPPYYALAYIMRIL